MTIVTHLSKLIFTCLHSPFLIFTHFSSMVSWLYRSTMFHNLPSSCWAPNLQWTVSHAHAVLPHSTVRLPQRPQETSYGRYDFCSTHDSPMLQRTSKLAKRRISRWQCAYATPCHALIEVPSTWALQIEFPSFRGALFFLKTSLKSDLVLSNGNFGYPVSILKFGWCILNVTGIHVMLYKKHWRPAGWPSPSLLSG